MKLTRYNMDTRLAKLGRNRGFTYTRVVSELQSRGFNILPSDFSKMKNGYIDTPKSNLVLSEADKIISKWEAENCGK